MTNQSVRERFLQLYSYTFEESLHCTGCPNDIETAIFKFMWIIKKHNTQETLTKASMLSKYTMKQKVRLYSSSLNMVITSYNCTDDIAEVLIKENPKHKELFTVNVTEEPQPIETFSVVNPEEETQEVEKESNPFVEQKKKRGRKKKVA